MDEFDRGYEEEEYDPLPEGVHEVEITEVVTGTSKSSGLPMRTFTVKVEGTGITLKHYIVKNENYNKNMTKFFDCFGIPRGDFEYMNWKGKTGKAYIGKREDGIYHEIKYLVAGPVNQASSTEEA
jgi:hypothetical protein